MTNVQMDIFMMLGEELEPPKVTYVAPSHIMDGKTESDEIVSRKYEYSNLAMDMEAKAKSKGTFNSVFPNQEATLLQYLLIQMKNDGLITNGDVDKCSRFHEIARAYMDRREHKLCTCEYLSSYITDESFHKLGINNKAIKKCIRILTKLGYLRVVTVKGNQRYLYPMLCRLPNSDYLPNVTYEEAKAYFFPKKDGEI